MNSITEKEKKLNSVLDRLKNLNSKNPELNRNVEQLKNKKNQIFFYIDNINLKNTTEFHSTDHTGYANAASRTREEIKIEEII